MCRKGKGQVKYFLEVGLALASHFSFVAGSGDPFQPAAQRLSFAAFQARTLDPYQGVPVLSTSSEETTASRLNTIPF